MIATGHAQQSTNSDAQTKPPRAVDRATLLIRREVEAKAAERAREFDLVKELAPAPVAGPQPGPVIMLERLPDARRGKQVVAGGRLIILELQEDDHIDDDDDAADEKLPRQPKIVVSEQSFELAVFRSVGGASSARKMIELFQTTQIEKIVRQHRLSAGQQSKLVLAARGDVKRIFDQIDESRNQFRLLKTDVNRCRNFLRDVEPFNLVVMTQRLSDPETLFAKILKKITEDDARGQVPR
jgi:hypothetical protein